MFIKKSKLSIFFSFLFFLTSCSSTGTSFYNSGYKSGYSKSENLKYYPPVVLDVLIPVFNGGIEKLNDEDLKNFSDIRRAESIHFAVKLKNKIKSLSLKWVGYLSTTGVYGNTYGDWVCEKDQPNPFQERSQRRLNCEREWISSNLPIQIFRLPGIYGPGRSTLEAIKTKKIKVIDKENQVFSRIHVADIANAIIYLIQNKNNLDFHQIINIADDEPCSQIEVIRYGYQLLGLEMPKKILFEEAKKDLSLIAQSFWKENRRVSNKLLCEKLGYKLIYKNYKAGLNNCLIQIKS